MRIRGGELVQARLRLRERFETSFGAVEDRDVLLLRLESEVGESWSEVVTDRDPYYNGETVETARHIIRDFLLPMLREREISGGREAHAVLARVRGNHMARAAVEMNTWNLEALAKGLPLRELLGGVRERVAVGVSVGLQESDGATVEKIAAYLDRGYRRIKVKIKPGRDRGLVEAIRQRYPHIALTVDANAAYTLADTPLFEALDTQRLDYIEQPLAHEDLLDHSRLAARLRTPICLDESIHGAADCRLAIEIGACRIVNIKPGRVGGFTESIAIHDACRAASIPVWCGGMLESGVGRAYNVHLATLPNFSMPGDISESARYWAEDIVEPPFVLDGEGCLPVPAGVGIGVRVRAEAVRRFETAREKI